MLACISADSQLLSFENCCVVCDLSHDKPVSNA